jgi:hypothetical protein
MREAGEEEKKLDREQNFRIESGACKSGAS